MLPRDFHPLIQRWWQTRFADAGSVLAPTEAQLEGWAAIRRGVDTLIAAPTGSGKTLAAFLTAIDQLLREGLDRGELPDEVRVIYVSPLKALSADIHKNLAEPRREIRRLAEEMGLPPVRITAAVRSGDEQLAPRERPTSLPAGARLAMLPGRRPVGIDPDSGAPVVLGEVKVGRKRFVPNAVAATLPPGWTRTLLPASARHPLAFGGDDAPILPQWAYTAAALGADGPVAFAMHTDRRGHWSFGRWAEKRRRAFQAQLAAATAAQAT